MGVETHPTGMLLHYDGVCPRQFSSASERVYGGQESLCSDASEERKRGLCALSVRPQVPLLSEGPPTPKAHESTEPNETYLSIVLPS